ncbi:MAG: class I SAM-dependent methyltransferase [Pseudomonadota bacterium]
MAEQGGGFSADWLALREPVDHASINAEVRRQLLRAISSRDRLRIVDLGSGTGSNYRGLAPWLPATEQHWLLCDIEPDLLAVAESTERLPRTAIETLQADFNGQDLDRLTSGADVITAAAFFDVASQDVVERIAVATAAAGAAFYTVLTYDGLAAWFPEHPLNSEMRSAFNAHQETDKGMGTALGPRATQALADAFAARGYTVHRGPSPWVIRPEHQALQRALDTGWAQAAVESSYVTRADADAWIEARHVPDAVSVVGHEDLLALPPA